MGGLLELWAQSLVRLVTFLLSGARKLSVITCWLSVAQRILQKYVQMSSKFYVYDKSEPTDPFQTTFRPDGFHGFLSAFLHVGFSQAQSLQNGSNFPPLRMNAQNPYNAQIMANLKILLLVNIISTARCAFSTSVTLYHSPVLFWAVPCLPLFRLGAWIFYLFLFLKTWNLW